MRPWCAPLLAAVLALAVAGSAAGAPLEWVGDNPADRLLARPLEEPRYDHARRCVRTPSPGALALARWLGRNSAGQFWGIMRCERLGPRNFSLHAEGRAVDWHLDARRPADRRAAQRLIRLLLAPDRLGNPHALARRMGAQEIIWNCRAWWSGGEGMEPYRQCYDRRGRKRSSVSRTLAHRDHVHLGLNRSGARGQTSFWRR
jgi:hypothetical protein